MTQKRFVTLTALVILFALPGISVGDCGPCEYKDGTLGICLPKAGCVIDQINPVTQAQKIITLASTIASGDAGAVKQSLGDVLITSPNCLACKSVVHNVVPNLSDAQINEAVGEGFLVYLATGDPVLVTIDAVANVASQQSVRTQQPQLPAVPQSGASKRAAKAFKVTAVCLVKKKGDPYIYAAWKSPAAFTDSKGAQHQYPDVDLLAGDTLTVTAPLCPEWTDKANGQESLTSAKFTFEAVSSLTGKPEAIKWFAYGRSR